MGKEHVADLGVGETNIKIDPKEIENCNIQLRKKTKHKIPTIKMEGSAYPSRGRNNPRMA
jgi:hypothetical protein